jgi:hypothetical protein
MSHLLTVVAAAVDLVLLPIVLVRKVYFWYMYIYDVKLKPVAV